MTCRDAAASLDDFVEGSLPLARRQALANHLHECATCTQALKEVRCTRRLLRRLPRERMPDPMKNGLLDELRKSRKQPDPHHLNPIQTSPHTQRAPQRRQTTRVPRRPVTDASSGCRHGIGSLEPLRLDHDLDTGSVVEPGILLE